MSLAATVSTTENENTFQLIIDLSEHMLEQARAGNWHTVQALEARRRTLITEYFTYPPVHGDAHMMAQQIRTVLEIDDGINGLCRSGRNDLARTLEQMNRGRKANKAYTQNSG